MSTRRIALVGLGIGLVLSGVMVRLLHLQVVHGAEFKEKAENRSLHLRFLPYKRGTIYGRRGEILEPLVEDRPSHDISVILKELDPIYILAERIPIVPPYEQVEAVAATTPAKEIILGSHLDRKHLGRVRSAIRDCRKDARIVERETDFDVIVLREAILRPRITLEKLASITDVDPQEALNAARAMIRKAVPLKDRYQMRYDLRTPRRIHSAVDFETALRVEGMHEDLPGVTVVEGVRRSYPWGATAGHLLGYLGYLNQEEVEALKEEKRLVNHWRDLREIDSILTLREGAHFRDDFVGRQGLERVFEASLRGAVGAELIKRDARGRIIEEVNRLDPRPGEDLLLSIDIDVQAAAEKALAEEVTKHGAQGGAVVAIDVKTGGIVALASYPSYDPSTFRKRYGELAKDPKKPLLNRAIMQTYPPGSTFKILIAIAALETGVMTPGERVYCSGRFRANSPFFKCHGGRPCGTLDLGQALERSCNVFFYEMGQRLGIDRIRQYALRYGFGRTVGIELPGEVEGFLPSKERPTPNPKDGHAWTKGYDRNIGIGQGNLRVTPLQMACLLAAVAGDGAPVTPHLTGGKVSGQGRPLPTRTLHPIQDGLRRVVMGERGTAREVESLRRTLAAGKTGTAQAGDLNEAWFAGYAPATDPQVAVAVVLEKVDAGGGTAAGPVVAAVFEAYLGRD